MGQASSSPGRDLRAAIARSDADTVRAIVAAAPRAVLHESFWRRRTPLMAASKRGDLLTVTSLLWAAERALGPEFPGYVNAVDLAGAGALLLAVRAGHAPVVRALLGAGATPLPADRHGNTTLHVAAAKGHAACAALLLDARVREAGGRQVAAAQAMVRGAAGEQRYIDAHNQYGFAPLHLAAVAHSHATAGALVQRGALLDVPVVRGLDRAAFMCGGSTPLHIAAAQGDARTCAVLLDGQWRHPGLELRRVRNMLGLTPLNCALLGGYQEAVRVLVAPRRRGGAGGEPASAAAFPASLRTHMLALLRRAALLLQLRGIAAGWGAAGGGVPGDATLEQYPGLEQLTMAQIARLRRLLQRQDASLRDVLQGLESAMLQRGEGSSGEGSSASGSGSEDGAAERGRPPDWGALGAELEEAAGDSAAAAVAAAARARRRGAGRRRAAGGAAESGARARARHRLQQTLSDVVSLAGAPPPAPPAAAEASAAARLPGKSAAAPPASAGDLDECSICMDAVCEVALAPCAHALCFKCACHLCAHATAEAATCPYCRREIASVVAVPGARGGAAPASQAPAAVPAPALALQAVS